MTADELLATSDDKLTPWQRALARAAREAELFHKEQLRAARGEDPEAPIRELMFWAGRLDSPYRPEDR